MKTFRFTYNNNHLNFQDCVVDIDARNEKSARKKFALYIHEICCYYCPTDITVTKVEVKDPALPGSFIAIKHIGKKMVDKNETV